MKPALLISLDPDSTARIRTPLLRLIAAATMTTLNCLSAVYADEPIRLWTGNAPGSLGNKPQDVPTLTRISPDTDTANGTAVVICPGGGYAGLAPHEGKGYADYLAAHGIECFVLKYRLGSDGYHHPAMIHDAQRAIRMVRANAPNWKIDPQRIGIMGSSAGGHLASTAIVHHDAGDAAAADPVDRQSSRPDFGILCYPVISMRDGVCHGGSRNNLLGDHPDPKLIDWLSTDENVDKDTPPCFIWTTGEDTAVPPENTLLFASALMRAKIPCDLHIYQKGGHGMGLGNGRKGNTVQNAHPWASDLVFWFGENGWLTRSK
jgi:acetyl esterase/lipase